MPRVCTVCTHPKRAEIDLTLASGSAAKRRIALKYGLIDVSIGRHEKNCLDPSLVAAQDVARTDADMTARDVIVELVVDLRGMAKECKSAGTGRDFLDVADRLVRANEQYAKINKELGSDQVNAFFIELGVRDDREIRGALDLARSSRDIPLPDFLEDCLSGAEMALSQMPEKRQYALQRLGGKMLQETNGGANGNG